MTTQDRPQTRPARVYPKIESPAGETIVFQHLDRERLVMEASYLPGRPLPPLHYHPEQEEEFLVLAGEIRTLIDGTERTYFEGEGFRVPRGVSHSMGAGYGAARLRWTVRPALETKEFFEAMWAITREGPPRLMQLAVTLMRFRRVCRLAQPAYPVQLLMFGPLALLGKALGLHPWRPEWRASTAPSAGPEVRES